MAEIVFRAPRAGDAQAVAADMREQDVAEVRAIGETDLVAAIADSIADSVLCWTVEADGQVAAVLGVVPIDGLLGSIGAPWMLGTPLVRRHGGALERRSRSYIARMLDAYPHLVNFVHADNHVAVRWLRRAGFELQPAQPFGPMGALFHRFDMRI